jgi:hypothetical protein
LAPQQVQGFRERTVREFGTLLHQGSGTLCAPEAGHSAVVPWTSTDARTQRARSLMEQGAKLTHGALAEALYLLGRQGQWEVVQILLSALPGHPDDPAGHVVQAPLEVVRALLGQGLAPMEPMAVWCNNGILNYMIGTSLEPALSWIHADRADVLRACCTHEAYPLAPSYEIHGVRYSRLLACAMDAKALGGIEVLIEHGARLSDHVSDGDQEPIGTLEFDPDVLAFARSIEERLHLEQGVDQARPRTQGAARTL